MHKLTLLLVVAIATIAIVSAVPVESDTGKKIENFNIFLLI